MKKLAIVTTHPIQYYAPIFRLMQQRGNIAIKVFYTWGQGGLSKHDPGFNRTIDWDIPLMDGYDYELVDNTSPDPGSHKFNGIINPSLIKQIENYHPDAILVIGWAYHSHLRVMRYFHGKIPVYFRGDSTLLDQPSGPKQLVKNILLRWVYSHVDHAFYVGQNNLAYFKKYGLKDNKLSFAPHAIDNARFAKPRPAEASSLRDNLGIPPNAILIFFAGKFEPKKSPDLLLEAFKQLNNPDVHLLFAGNGHLEAELKASADSNPNIHFTDFVNQADMPVLYQACDIFCLPSQGPNETWGLAVNEAMACGKAVLVSDKCGCAADLVTRENGIVFKHQNLAELVLGLKKLTNSRQTLQQMGEQSATIIAGWNFTSIASAIENRLLNEKI